MSKNHCVIKSNKIHPDNQEIANEYLKSLKLSNKSPVTINKYRWVLEMLLIFVDKPIEELNSDDILQWLTTDHHDKKEKTINLFISVLSGFFKFCLTEEYIDKILIKKRWRPKIPSSLPKHLDSHEQAKLKLNSETLTIRNRAIIEFLLSTGCRRSEVASLNLEDVDLDNRTAIVTGKGKRIREVHFSVECSILLKMYLKERISNEKALFVSNLGKRLKGPGIYKVTTKLGIKSGLQNSLSPHVFRHTFASNMLSKGADLQFIGDILGHTDLNTTRVYARIPTQDIIAQYNKRMGWI